MGFIAQLIMPLYGLIPIGVYPPTAQTPTTQPMVPTPKNIIDHTKQSRSTNIVVPPALLQLWANDPEMVKFLTSLDFVVRLVQPSEIPSPNDNLRSSLVALCHQRSAMRLPKQVYT